MEVSKAEELLDWSGSNCWFCGRRPPVHGMSRLVYMRKVVDGEGGGMKWLYSSVAVPRCAECRAGHVRVNEAWLYPSLGAALVAFLIVFAIDMGGGAKAFVVLLAGAVVGVFVGATAELPEGQKSDATAASYTAVQLMLEGGWVITDSLPPPP
jgi:hypothetical protein